ncbi:MAG TPA: LLM class flavin-dependent oxidoreductase, partial [Nocardioides sp.]|nr:LLM class flavin-dependent oxidoreductase [Nocardioides sp.]
EAFGYSVDHDEAREKTALFRAAIAGAGVVPADVRMTGSAGMLPIQPQSPGLPDRIWWGAASDGTAEWAGEKGMNLMSSTLKQDESGEPFHVQQRKQIEKFHAAWDAAGHTRTPRVSVSRSIFPLVSREDHAYFGQEQSNDQIGEIDNFRAVFGRSYAAEPDQLIEQLREDEAIAAADTLLLTVPNQLGVEYNAHVLESILTHVAPELGWR